ncbi:MAG: pyridoxine 5'-phosphate synthase [Polyangiaceae bacterium]
MRFHVNIDHVATVRNARGTTYPDPTALALECEQAGADGITAHLREDRRHMRDDDIERLRARVTTLLNLEMAATTDMTRIAERLRPNVITLVPERREERTTEGGLDVIGQRAAIEPVMTMARRAGIRVSLFIAPDPSQVRASKDLAVDQIELHTGDYCNRTGAEQREELTRLASAAKLGAELGLEIAAGHGLTRDNLPDVVAIPEITELNIGHAVIADAIAVGIKQAVLDFRVAIDKGLARRRK